MIKCAAYFHIATHEVCVAKRIVQVLMSIFYTSTLTEKELMSVQHYHILSMTLDIRSRIEPITFIIKEQMIKPRIVDLLVFEIYIVGPNSLWHLDGNHKLIR